MINYRFEFENGNVWEYCVDINRQYTKEIDNDQHSFWTPLSFHQCQNCPLSNSEFFCCPAAVDLQNIVNKFSQHASFERATVSVKTPARTYVHQCDVQLGLSSLIGLVMATSACPIINQLRPLAHFHLPFATSEETIFRTVGAYLVKQYFLMKEGSKPDIELHGLDQLYADLISVNTNFCKRIRAASEQDANLNAIIHHDSISVIMQFSLKDGLSTEKLRFMSGCL